MKILYTALAVLLASTSIVIGDFDCEIVPFAGRKPSITRVYQNNQFSGNDDDRLSWEVIERPIGGYIGDILIKDKDAVGAKARLRCYEVTTDDLFKPLQDQPEINWFGEMGLYNSKSKQRKLLHEHIWQIDKVPFKAPIFIPGYARSLGRCIFEIIDNQDDTLYSCIPAEVFQGKNEYNRNQSSAWIFNEDEESDRRMKTYAGIHNVENLTEIPGDWTHFANVKAIWIDGNTDISAELMRQVILSGGWIFGKEEGLAPQLAKLGIKPTSILMGGIYPLEKKRDEEVSPSDPFSGLHAGGDDRFKFCSYSRYSAHDASPMEDAVHLFDRIKTPYLIFTFTVAGLYAIGATVLLPFLFLRLKGSRRVELWWKTPLVITGYTLIMALIGFMAIQPKATVSDATEYRLGYSDWPEVFCNINSVSLKFVGEPFGWKFPKSTITTYSDKTGSYMSVIEQPDTSGTMIMNKAVRGIQSLNGFAYIKKMRQPFRAKLNDKKVEISTERDLRNICVRLANGEWIELGDLKRGESLTLPDTFESVDIIFPDAVSKNIRANHLTRICLAKNDKANKPCKNCKKVHSSSDKSLELYDGSMLIIALDEHDQPAITGIQEQQDHTGRVAWICQVPVEDYNNPIVLKDVGIKK